MEQARLTFGGLVVDFASCVEANRQSRQRLEAVVASLKDGDLARVVGGEWTRSATLAHVAFWDRQIEVWLHEWQQRGFRTAAELEEWDRSLDGAYWFGLNDALLPQWLGTPPRDNVLAARAAVESLNRTIESLDADLVRAILDLLPGAGTVDPVPQSMLLATRSP